MKFFCKQLDTLHAVVRQGSFLFFLVIKTMLSFLMKIRNHFPFTFKSFRDFLLDCWNEIKLKSCFNRLTRVPNEDLRKAISVNWLVTSILRIKVIIRFHIWGIWQHWQMSLPYENLHIFTSEIVSSPSWVHETACISSWHSHVACLWNFSAIQSWKWLSRENWRHQAKLVHTHNFEENWILKISLDGARIPCLVASDTSRKARGARRHTRTKNFQWLDTHSHSHVKLSLHSLQQRDLIFDEQEMRNEKIYSWRYQVA